MGHSKAQKAATHDRLIGIAATRFLERGLDGVSVGDLMKEAGLTVGGFYKHFDSRDALVREAVAAAMAASEARVARRQSVAAGLDSYLSLEHRDNPGDGCAIAALANDAGRTDAETRTLFARDIERRLESMERDVVPPSGMAERAAAIVKLSALVGAVSLARATADSAVSAEILETVKAFLGETFGGVRARK